MVVTSVIFTVMFRLVCAKELLEEGVVHLLNTGAALSFFEPGVRTLRLTMFEEPSGNLPTLVFSPGSP